MTEFLLNIDLVVFYFINHTITNNFLDKLMPFITEIRNWYLVYIFLFTWLFWKGGKKGRIAAITLIIAIILSDQISSHILKELFSRTRPCQALDNVRLLVTCGSGKSFPSSHAVNNFVAATILSYFYKQYKIIYFSIASLMALSRVYVGVHYPSDIIAGALLGFLVAWLLIYMLKKNLKIYKI
jgi:undecaprenyl-diphosphatase